MNPSNIYVFRGIASQTGLAARARFPDAGLQPYDTWDEIPGLLVTQRDPVAVPIWNSHKGEVKNELWERLLEGQGYISDLWPAAIKFWHVGRPSSQVNSVCSVKVAEDQCSIYLKKHNLEFQSLESTSEAVEVFRKGQWDSVLTAPNQIDATEGFNLLTQDAANPNNFTSFVLIQQKLLDKADSSIKLSGVTLPKIEQALNEAQQDFFNSLFDDVKNLHDLPRPIFVFDREEELSSVGVLFESSEARVIETPATAEDIVSISVKDSVGRVAQRYTHSLETFLKANFSSFQERDFSRHRGSNACLFSCSSLEIQTHGYNEEVVEPVFRYFIDRVFQAIKNGLSCTEAQRNFFEKHRANWEENGRDFISFEDV